MRLLSNLSIARKLALAFALLVLPSLCVGGAVLVALGSIQRATDAQDRGHALRSGADAMLAALVAQQNAVRGYVISGTPNFLRDYEEKQAEYNAAMAAFRTFGASPSILSRLEAVDAIAREWRTQSLDRQIAIARDPQRRSELAGFVSGSYLGRIREGLADIQATLTQNLQEEDAAVDRAAALTTAMLVGGIILSSLLALILGWLLTRAIGGPITAMTGVMQRLAAGDNAVEVPGIGRRDEVGRMAGAVGVFRDAALAKLQLESDSAAQRRQAEAERQAHEAARAKAAAAQAMVVDAVGAGLERLAAGDLTCRLDRAFPAEYEGLRGNFNAAIGQLQDAMQAVVASAEAIRSGTGEISRAADDLSRRTEQQAASLEETAAALDEITATVRKAAEGAGHARDVVSRTGTDAEHSGEVVRQAVVAMSGIERSSQQITQIIGVIDEIAFQTNLLALNAGVEAARAGEAGRGFAVVASEVRALAQRSAEAAKEIKALISNAAQEVGAGVRLVGETGTSLERIVSQVSDIILSVSGIAASAQEQATGLAEVNTAVNQMDQVTQQNAAMVEQTTAASHTLAREAEALTALTDRFQVGREAGERTPSNVAPLRRPAHAAAPQGARSAFPRPLRGGRDGNAVRKPAAEEQGWEEF